MLSQLTGTENDHRLTPRRLIADGAKHLADEAGGCWRLDAAISHLLELACQSKQRLFRRSGNATDCPNSVGPINPWLSRCGARIWQPRNYDGDIKVANITSYSVNPSLHHSVFEWPRILPIKNKLINTFALRNLFLLLRESGPASGSHKRSPKKISCTSTEHYFHHFN